MLAASWCEAKKDVQETKLSLSLDGTLPALEDKFLNLKHSWHSKCCQFSLYCILYKIYKALTEFLKIILHSVPRIKGGDAMDKKSERKKMKTRNLCEPLKLGP